MTLRGWRGMLLGVRRSGIGCDDDETAGRGGGGGGGGGGGVEVWRATVAVDIVW